MEYFEGDVANLTVFIDRNISLERELSVNLTVEFGKLKALLMVK